MDRTKHDKHRRIRWLYRLLDKAAARVDPNRLAEHLEPDTSDDTTIQEPADRC